MNCEKWRGSWSQCVRKTKGASREPASPPVQPFVAYATKVRPDGLSVVGGSGLDGVSPHPEKIYKCIKLIVANRCLWREKDRFTSPHFPGLKIKGVTIFKK